MQETEEIRVQSLGWEDPLEEGMATHSSILAWASHGQRSLGAPVQGVAQSRTRLRDWVPPPPANFKQNKTSLGPQARGLLSFPSSPLTRWVSGTEVLCHEEAASQKATWDELAGMSSVSWSSWDLPEGLSKKAENFFLIWAPALGSYEDIIRGDVTVWQC